MTCGIYKLTSPTGRVYIGQSENIERRWIEHRSCSKKKHPKLYYSVRKYGFDAFHKEIIETCHPDCLPQKEIYYIKKYGSFNNGLNSTTGGEKSYRRTQETKDKIRKSLLGKYYGSDNEEFFIGNLHFKSIAHASLTTGIPPKTIYNRLNSPNAKYANYLYVDVSKRPDRRPRVSEKRKQCSAFGVIYASLKEASIALHIPIATLSRYLINKKHGFSYI